MIIKFLLATLLLSSSAWANLHLAPPDFDTQDGRAIFVDFKTANYEINYNVRSRRTHVKSTITFVAKRRGHPVFDLVKAPWNIRLNGEAVGQRLISLPGGVSKVRMLDREVEPGEYVLEMENTFRRNTIYSWAHSGVHSAFWIRDLKDRKFLEQYIPSNFEFDQYQMSLDVKFRGLYRVAQEIYTNGKVTKINHYTYRIEFPSYFTVSSPYFHTTPRGWMKRKDFHYTSIDGREIPITVYSPWRSRTNRFAKETIRVMKELEEDYGPWGHPSFVAYGTLPGTGGMEHAGATATSFAALDHEMLHSYFAKGVMPANGNSGWIDEAIASWRDKGYQRFPDPGFSGSNLGAHSVYQRNTDKRAYALGARFMAYLDWRLQDMGGLKAFLKGYFHAYKHQVVTTEHFKNNLEFFSGLDLSGEFDTYIWGKNSSDVEELLEENPHHLPLTDRELRKLL